jgi:hypothetical protein
MSRSKWTTSQRPQKTPKDAERCEATVYLSSGESGRCRRRWTCEHGLLRYCCQHVRIARRSLNGREKA